MNSASHLALQSAGFIFCGPAQCCSTYFCLVAIDDDSKCGSDATFMNTYHSWLFVPVTKEGRMETSKILLGKESQDWETDGMKR